MKVELHLHTSRYSGCAVATPSELLERMVPSGYGAVFITEHDAVWSDWELDQLRNGHGGIGVFPGVELSVGPEPAKHIIVLGTNDPAYLRLRDAGDVLARARDEGHLTILAHPFRWPGAEEMLQAGHVPDALEHRTANHDKRQARRAVAAASEYGLALVNAGDVHDLHFLDRFWIETDRPLTRAEDLRAIVLNHTYVNCAGDGA